MKFPNVIRNENTWDLQSVSPSPSPDRMMNVPGQKSNGLIEEEKQNPRLNTKKRTRDEFDDRSSYYVQHPKHYHGSQFDRNKPADRSYAVGGGTGAGQYNDGKQRTVKVSRSELAGNAKSKLDFYNILAKEGQLYLPPYNECTMLFIRDITMGKKKVRWLRSV
jgi:hypothetical protein